VYLISAAKLCGNAARVNLHGGIVKAQLDFGNMRRLAAICFATFLITGCSGSGATSLASPSAASPTPSAAPSATPSTAPALATPTAPSPKKGSFKLTRIAFGLQSPVYVTGAGDGSGRLFTVEQAGEILILQNGALRPTPFLDIRSLVASGGERGLLSVAFHPQFKTNGVFVVDYTRASSTLSAVGDTVIARFIAAPNANIVNPASGQILLVIKQPQPNHNGGLVKFGPDGLLYIGMGDGGSSGDSGTGHAPQGNGQSRTTLLGKMLRISVGATGPYSIPATNPNLGSGARREIWAYGLRNPWRFSFDRGTGDLYIGDVGQNAWEEIDLQAAGFAGGANYGWPVWEGDHRYRFAQAISGDTKPIAEYSHVAGQCSVTGGYVYRGTRIPALSGFYVFGDYCAGRILALVRFGGQWRQSLVLDTVYQISSFGEDDAGELYLVDLTGAVYRFDPTS
jgi:glucose/arabinose dehydrogenase